MKTKFLMIIYIFVLSVLFISSCSIFKSRTETNDKYDMQDLVNRGLIPEGFIAVEKDPVVDMARIRKCTVYPEKAQNTGIEGRVIIRILIQHDGKVTKTVIEETDNEIFNDAAIQTIDCYGDFIPAIQDGKPIICWVSIPITFRIKNKDKKNEY